MGLALLNGCGASGLDGLVKGAAAAGGGLLVSITGVRSRRTALSDSYECHATLPGSNILIITNARLLMVVSEAFAVLEAEVDAGRQSQA
jgi:hypothetical protein